MSKSIRRLSKLQEQSNDVTANKVQMQRGNHTQQGTLGNLTKMNAAAKLQDSGKDPSHTGGPKGAFILSSELSASV